MKKLKLRFAVGFVLFLFSTQCGVKGDPLPPLQPHNTERTEDRFGDTTEMDEDVTVPKKDQ